MIPLSKMVSVPHDRTSGRGWHYDPRGWIQVDEDGAVVEGIQTSASINVAASNVTIANNRVRIIGDGWGVGLSSGSGITVANNDIYSPAARGDRRMLVGIKDIYGKVSNVTVAQNDIWHASTGVQMDAGVIRDNYIHDPGYKEGDHLNGILSTGGSEPLLIRHNTVFTDSNQTDAIGLFQDFAPQENRTVTKNFLGGGGYTIYGGASPDKRSRVSRIVITNNRFAQHFHDTGGYWGPVAYFEPGQGNVWRGNYWDNSGKDVEP